MSLSLEHLDSCVPVTGLKAVQYDSLSLLLQGQGPFASVINTQTGQLLCKTRVFRRNNIHGFMIDESRRQQHDKARKIDILVWGGQSLRILSLSSSHDGQATTLAHETAEYVAPDWVYDVCASHIKDTLNLAYAITGHNSLLSIHLVDNTQRDSSSRYPRGIRLKRVAAGVKSTLYSANVVALSPSHILMAAGTVFGEIIVWSCFREVETKTNFSSIHHFFTGHDGSVFGVNISEEIIVSTNDADKKKPTSLLASCSDDRTIRIWDISDCFDITSADASAYQTDDGFALRSTGFGSTAPANIAGGSEIAVAKEWGHVSRIWGVYFLPVKNKSRDVVNLVSRGEDATCQLWRLDLKPQKNNCPTRYDLRNLSILSHHVGKQIWSLCLAKEHGETTVVYTGGGDGGIRVFELDYLGDAPAETTTNLPDNSLYNSRTMVKFANSRTNNDNLLKSFAFVSKDSLITVSDSGAVQVGKVGFCSKFQTKPQITWQDISLEEDLRFVTSIATLPRRGIALIGSSSSRVIRLYDHQTKKLGEVTSVTLRPVRILVVDLAEGRICFVVCYMKTDYVDLFYVENESYQTRRIRVSIPISFEVTVATAFCHDKYLALGGKGGGLMVYSLDFQTDILEYIFCDYREMEKNTLRCILPIDDPDDSQSGYILSGGQNGTFSVHGLRQQTSDKAAAETRLVHQAHTPFPHVEGAYFDAKTGHLMLMCGKGGLFVIWDETTQTQVMVLECGGARRILDFMPSFETTGSGIFAWNQQRALYVLVADSVPCRPPLRIGSHGRELKSVAVGYWSSRKIPYIATAGEDTAIRISVPAFLADGDNNNNNNECWAPLRCLRVMTHHITGLQQVQWSADGRFLFSSGGREEFFVWKITRSVPRLGLAVLREGVCPRESFELELRIMSFDVLRLEATEAEEGEERFLIALVYSNSTVKVFLYTSLAGRGTFDLLLQGTYSSNCLTEVHFIEIGSTRFLVTGATDGYIAFWPLPSITTLTQNHSPQSAAPPGSIEWTIHHAIHTSSIKSLETTNLSATCHLLIGGGDDNSLSITTFRFEEHSSSKPVISTVCVPNAHASAITAIKILDVRDHNNEHEGSVVVDIASSGNDQRVKLWRVSIDNVSKRISVSLDVNWYCAVADVAAMDVMEMPANSDTEGETERVLVVAGVGMDMLRLVRT